MVKGIGSPRRGCQWHRTVVRQTFERFRNYIIFKWKDQAMGIFDVVREMGHEQVVFSHDRSSGLKAIIAIHDTTLGPALGGCRFWNYESEDAAILDVLGLSRGMTYKAAVAGLHLGGGKAVIIGDPKELKSEAFFRAFG